MNTENETLGTIRDTLNIFFKHKTKMIIIFASIVITVTIGSLVMTPVYEVSSKIIVKVGRENLFMATTPTAKGNPPALFDDSKKNLINSEIEILRGRNLTEKVLNELGVKYIYPGIDKPPLIPIPLSQKLTSFEKATLKLQDKLELEGIEDSDIIEVKFQHTNPVIAVQVVEKLIDHYLEHHLSIYNQPQKQDFFDEQVELLAGKLKASENELEVFRTQNTISSLNEQKTFLLKQISDMEIDLAKTRSEISEHEGKMQALKGNAVYAHAEAKMGEETDFNPQAISAIRSRLAELRLKEEEMRGKYNEESVVITNIKNEINKAQELLANEEKTYHEKVVTSLTHTLNALRSKEESQQQHLNSYQQELNRVSALELKLKELERQVTINEENYQLYVRNMEESRISNAMDNQKIANISIIEPPLLPIKYVKPTKTLNILLSIIIGALAALGWAYLSEYLSHSFNNRADVKKQLGVQVLATIPEMRGN